MKYLVFLFIIITSCCTANKTSVTGNEAPVTILPKEKTITATVVDLTGLDGCTFLLQLENGEKLEPINLKEEFKIINLAVLIRYHQVKQMSACMAGKIVELDFISKK